MLLSLSEREVRLRRKPERDLYDKLLRLSAQGNNHTVDWRNLVERSDLASGVAEPVVVSGVDLCKDLSQFLDDIRLDCASPPGVPFSDVLWPSAYAALSRLRSDRSSFERGVFAESCLLQFAGALCDELCHLTASTLYPLFASERNKSAPGSYNRFVSRMRDGGLAEIFSALPVLGRLVAVRTRFWVEYVAELGRRLVATWPELTQFAGADPLPVTGAFVFDSDSHRRGQRICCLRSSNGRHFVYKPRSLQIDLYWARISEALQSAGAPYFPRAVKVLTGDGFGFCEFVQPTPMTSGSRRAANLGGLTGLLWSLGATDMHSENVVFCGDHPVVLDLETLLTPATAPRGAVRPMRKAVEQVRASLEDSVLSIGILPMWQTSPSTEAIPTGVLNSPEPAPLQAWRWEHVNTDEMRPLHQAEPTSVETAEAHWWESHIDAFLGGLRDTLHYIGNRSKLFLEPSGLLNAVSGLTVRFVARPTAFYSRLLQRSRHPIRMRSGQTWGREFDTLDRFVEPNDPTANYAQLLDAEKDALARLDVPYFVAATTDCTVEGEGRRIRLPGMEPARARAVRRISSLTPTKIDFEAFLASNSLTSDCRPSIDGTAGPAPGSLGGLARSLIENAVQDSQSVAWLGAVPVDYHNAHRIVALGPQLYAGAGGVSVALAAYSKVCGDAHVARLAKCALAFTADLVANESDARRFVRTSGFGFGGGAGGVIYSLLTVGRLLNDLDLVASARRLALFMTEERQAIELDNDLMSGHAGALLAVCALAEHTQEKPLFELARQLADNVISSGRGDRQNSARVGVAHGRAGAALALAKYAKLSCSDREANLAADLLEADLASYSQTDGSGWCRGTAGLALAADITADTPIRAERRSRLQQMRDDLRLVPDTTKSSLDTLCCGAFGKMDVALRVGARSANAELVDLTTSEIDKRIAQFASDAPKLALSVHLRLQLGLFGGLAGLLYVGARALSPTTIPCVLSGD